MASQPKTTRRFEAPPAIRSLIMLEACASMITGRKRPSFGRQVEISVREQGSSRWNARLLASDSPDGIDAVASREADLAIINPSAVLTLAYRGTGSYRRPLPVRAITVLPQRDVVVLAVTAGTGLTYLEEVAERRYPLRISLRGQEPGHSIHLALSDILAAAGCPLWAIESWGGQLHYDPGFDRFSGLESGERNAIFDEAFPVLGEPALEAGMRLLSLRDETLERLTRLGYRRATLTPDDHPALTEPVQTIDFSGWPLFCHTEASDELVERFCAGLEDRKERIPWEGPGPLPLERMCGKYPEAPLDVPLHPAAERFWRGQGYL
jgi:hypothetical protein